MSGVGFGGLLFAGVDDARLRARATEHATSDAALRFLCGVKGAGGLHRRSKGEDAGEIFR